MNSFIQSLEDIDLSPYDLDTKSFMHIVQQQNAFITNWYQHDRATLDSLSMLSHLMEVGKLILAKVVIETSSQKLFAYHINDTKELKEVIRIEKEIFDLSHEEVAAQLMQKWGFSPNIYKPMQYITMLENAPDEYRKQAAILHVTKLLINTHHFNKEQNYAKAISVVKEQQLKPKYFMAAYKQHMRREAIPA